ncbi:sugar ABC transporter permease [Marinilactibacillus sp. XAAS-LB27]|uniref:carbohydrate ABC transporter permease n=1 Tax=Marinilactibacillus sp. XAAS-LB27 TaxID=3114538 RepID=UPI002E1884A6|nr:sugar ABC transporter permease [Marinilactibacillus sp. XAAS-LB27]
MKSKKAPYFFIAPAIGLLLTFSIFPIILALVISFTDMSLAGLADYSRINFTGFQNYQNILQDSIFLKSITNTLFYVIFGVPLVILFSLTIAILINMGRSRYFSFMRVVFYSPSITNIVAVAIVWAFLFNPSQSIGLINRVIGMVGIGPIGWLTDTSVSKISLVILAVWRSIGINMLIFSAALQNIPRSMYEAAELDGATKWEQIRFITVPQLKFSTSFVTITTIIGWLQFFEEPFVMTEGGPLNSTTSVALFIYRNGFQNNQFGYAAAGSLLLFVVIICATLVQLRLQRRAD